MSKHSHISAIFDNAFQSRAGSPDVYMSMVSTRIPRAPCDVTTHVQDLFRWAMQTPVFRLTKNWGKK